MCWNADKLEFILGRRNRGIGDWSNVWHATENEECIQNISRNIISDSFERPRYRWEDSFKIYVDNCGVRMGLDSVKCV